MSRAVTLMALALLCSSAGLAPPAHARGTTSVGGSFWVGFGRSPRIHVGGTFYSGRSFYGGGSFYGGRLHVGRPFVSRRSVTFMPPLNLYYQTPLFAPYSYAYAPYLYGYGGLYPYSPYAYQPFFYSSPLGASYYERNVYVERPVYVERSRPKTVILQRPNRDDDYVYEWRSDARRRAERREEPSVGREADRVQFKTRPDGALQVTWTASPDRVESVTFVLLDSQSRSLEMDQVTEPPFTTVFSRAAEAVAVRVTIRYTDGVRQSTAVPLPGKGPTSAPSRSRRGPSETSLASADPYALYRGDH